MDHLTRLMERYPVLAKMEDGIKQTYEMIKDSYEKGGKLLVCGNGGSAADSDHIVGELMKGFYKQRKLLAEEKIRFGEQGEKLQGALPAIALTQHGALSTAFLNDVDPEMVFAQQVYGYGREGDVFLGLSTSGNSVNVISAAKVAASKGMKVITMTGKVMCVWSFRHRGRRMFRNFIFPFIMLCALCWKNIFSLVSKKTGYTERNNTN